MMRLMILPLLFCDEGDGNAAVDYNSEDVVFSAEMMML